jgi:hypothetical protein
MLVLSRLLVIAVCLLLMIMLLPSGCALKERALRELRPPSFEIELELDHPPAQGETTTVRAVVVAVEDCRQMQLLLHLPADATLVSVDFLPGKQHRDGITARTTRREFVSAGEEIRLEMQVSFAGTGWRWVALSAQAFFGSMPPGDPRYYDDVRTQYSSVHLTVYDDHGEMEWKRGGSPPPGVRA